MVRGRLIKNFKVTIARRITPRKMSQKGREGNDQNMTKTVALRL